MPFELADHELRQVVDRAKSLDPTAWDDLYRHSRSRLFSYARRRLPSDHAAEDAVSDAVVRAMDRIDEFRWEGAGFDAWMYGILRNVVLESYRRSGRVDALDSGRAERLPAGESSDGAHRVIADEERDELRRAFAQLDDDERELLELRVVGELSSDQVGVVVGKSAGAVRMAQSRALQRLRTVLTGSSRG